MQKCYYRSENDYFQVEQFTSRSFKVRSIFHTSSWTQRNNVPVSQRMETVQEIRSSQNTTCALFSNKTGHFHRRTFSYQSLQSIGAVSLRFAPTEILYFRQQAIISKSEKSTCNFKKKKTESQQKPFVARVLQIKP